jgi:signal transduction histidine kinase
MNHMVDDLLDFTRSRLGAAMPVDRRPMDLGQTLAEAIDETKASSPTAAVHLERSGDLRGRWDNARLRQVLSNLMGNAIDYGAPDTPIRVTARGEAEGVVVQVFNQGQAIPRDQLQRIFDPLTRSVPATGSSSHLGLGLYIVKQIVTAHGGSVAVESADPEGTTFTIRLPRAA